MKPRPTKNNPSIDKPYRIDITPSYLNICAHCNQCLEQIVANPDKLNVVLHYKDDDGTIKRWTPPSKDIAE